MSYKKILLIDDDSDDTKLFVDAVSKVNKQAVCQTALNPSKALQELALSDELPDLLFLDYNMPAVNGLEFIKRMRQSERLKNIEVIIMSTPPEEVMVPWFIKNNIEVKYISKPCSMEELENILYKLL